MPDSTALKATNSARVRSAIRRASVVLPVPGGPHRMIDCSKSRSIISRRGRPGATRSSWPTISPSERGRIRSASGMVFGSTGAGGSSNRLMLRCLLALVSGFSRIDELPLALRLIEQNRGGDGGIQRLDAATHRNADAHVRGGDRRVGQPGAFSAE